MPPLDLPTLRNATICWFLDGWKYLCDNPEIVRHAWGACRVPGEVRGLSLAYQSVSSDEAHALFLSLCAKDEEFGKEFLLLDFTSSIGNDCEESDVDDEYDDDLTHPPDEVDNLDVDAEVDFIEAHAVRSFINLVFVLVLTFKLTGPAQQSFSHGSRGVNESPC